MADLTIARTEGVYIVSDRNLKENIKPLSGALELVKKLEPKVFNYIGRNGTHFGLIAQDVERIMLDVGLAGYSLVSNKGTYSIDYGQLIIPILAAIQDLIKQIEALKAQ